MSFKILPMTQTDLTQIAALEKVCFPADPWSESIFRAALDNPRTAVLTAKDESGTVLGYAVVSAVLDEGSLDNIAVAPDCRRQGVADALLGVMTGYGRGELAFLTLEVRASNVPAVALYEKHGFVCVGRRKNYYDCPREDAILMTLEFEHGTKTAEKE